jgi:hypothetical protein
LFFLQELAITKHPSFQEDKHFPTLDLNLEYNTQRQDNIEVTIENIFKELNKYLNKEVNPQPSTPTTKSST